MRRHLLVACTVAVPLLALAQSIYKVQMPDGTILFTDTPPGDAKVLEERAARSTRPAAPAPAPTTRSPGSSPVPIMQPTGNSRSRGAVDAAAVTVQTAERELAVAKRALEVGREPLPGERLGLKGGGSRLSPEYDARIKTLENAVADAEAKAKRAYDSKNAVR